MPDVPSEAAPETAREEQKKTEELEHLREMEAEVIWGGPSLFVNRAYIVNTPFWIRIAFGDQGGPEEPIRHRVAITLTPPEAIAFSDTLAKVVEQYRPLVEAMTKPPTPAEEA